LHHPHPPPQTTHRCFRSKQPNLQGSPQITSPCVEGRLQTRCAPNAIVGGAAFSRCAVFVGSMSPCTDRFHSPSIGFLFLTVRTAGCPPARPTREKLLLAETVCACIADAKTLTLRRISCPLAYHRSIFGDTLSFDVLVGPKESRLVKPTISPIGLGRLTKLESACRPSMTTPSTERAHGGVAERAPPLGEHDAEDGLRVAVLSSSPHLAPASPLNALGSPSHQSNVSASR